MITVALVPELLEIWDWDKNEKAHLSPELISCGSHRSAYWICPIHHCTYLQIIRNRYRKQTGCALCKEEKAEAIPRERYTKGKTILADSHPALVQEWLSADNPKYTPYTVLSGSGAKVLWQCKTCSGKYYATVSNRALNGSGCPYCAGQKVLVGYNDLQTVNPNLASEWSSKNSITPQQVTAKSNAKVLWICKLGHEDYYSSIKQRSNGQGCPECAKESHTSFPEQAVFFYLRQVFPDAVNRAIIRNMEIDIYLPSIHKGIEYNGIFYHKHKRSHDLKKKNALLAEGIILLTIQEYDTDIVSKNGVEGSWNYESILFFSAGKTVLTAREVLALSMVGYPNGVLALSRNIYEQAVVLLFFHQHQLDPEFSNFVEDYHLDFEIKQNEYLQFEVEYCSHDPVMLSKLKTRRHELRDEAHQKRGGQYWWSGFSGFRDLFDNVVNMEQDPDMKDFLYRLHLQYKEACSVLHAGSLGNQYYLGVNPEFFGIDTSPKEEGLGRPLLFTVHTLTCIFGIICDHFKIDHHRITDPLNALAEYYLSLI